MGTSIKDIAQALNLSKTTISWILSGQGEKKGFSDATIKQVKDYAKEINYRPNQLARSLSIGETHTIGLIVPSIGDTFFAQMALAIEEVAEKQNYVLTICSSLGDGKREKRLIQALRDKRVDGLIIVPTEKQVDGIKLMLKDKYPFVLIDRSFSQPKTNSIVADDILGGFKLTESLISNGCEKIAFVTTDSHTQTMKKRLMGYMKALDAHSIKFDKNLYVDIDKNNYLNEVGGKTESLLNRVSEIDGIVFGTHYLAVGVIRYLLQRNMFDQDKIQVASFHSNIALEILVPTVAVARIPIGEMGAKAVDILLQNIKEPDMEKNEIVLNIDFEHL